MPDNIPDKAQLVVEIIESSIQEIKKIKNEGGVWWKILDKVAQLAASKTEMVAALNWGSQDKKSFAMDLFENLWFKYAGLKNIPDFIERPLVRFIADKAIDAFVSWMHKIGQWKHKNS